MGFIKCGDFSFEGLLPLEIYIYIAQICCVMTEKFGKVCEFLGFCSGIVEVSVFLLFGFVSADNWRLVLCETTGLSCNTGNQLKLNCI